ncbi:helix-turn-helix transcriptional regulator [Streptomyces sp. NBC_00083]|uniref:helix-turn-helix domain-containing protein n=1 Tax=Streptomyces sp. NBC_00083 TaxID=2975647 RepID=UPI00225A789D|nr:helix-turn-helix transcriptional regulator [Streptomyces sp. NBC_00083]MCX5384892.1 helix-turn-helix domain-containing protein [Streptomyces sp. NBC_00083]
MATTESEQFAALLRELKERSGRSYGVLAGRLHMSTSTLHRYCNGDAVPNEYAPVERLARLCGASPEESVELHRRWILADEARRRARGTNPAGAAPAAAPAPAAEPAAAPAETGRAADADAHADAAESGRVGGSGSARGSGPAPAFGSAFDSAPGPVPGSAAGPDPDPEPGPRDELPDVVASEAAGTPSATGRFGGKRTRLALIGAAVVALAVPAVAVAALSGPDDKPSGAVADAKQSRAAVKSAPPHTPGASASPTPSASASSSAGPSASAAVSHTKPAPKGGATGTPISVGISSYDWDTPCGKYYLLDQKPTAVPPPPPSEQDRRSWARALGGVDGGGLKLELTATGKSEDAVVITGISVRVVGREAPLAWTAYSMGQGCGGGVVPQTFDLDLDAPQPVTKPVAGHQGDNVVPAKDFPFKVSAHDPEVYDLDVHTEDHDVSWYLEVGWSSGERSGKVTVNDGGKPFHTSAVKGRPAYDYNPFDNAWEKLDAP